MSSVVVNPAEVIPITGNLEEVTAEIRVGAVFVVRSEFWSESNEFASATLYEWVAGRLATDEIADPNILDTRYYLGCGDRSHFSNGKVDRAKYIARGALSLRYPIDFCAMQTDTYEHEPSSYAVRGLQGNQRPKVEVVLGESAAKIVACDFDEAVANALADPETTYETVITDHYRVIHPPERCPDLYEAVPRLGAMLAEARDLTANARPLATPGASASFDTFLND